MCIRDRIEGTDEATGDSDAEAAPDQGSDDSSEGTES